MNWRIAHSTYFFVNNLYKIYIISVKFIRLHKNHAPEVNWNLIKLISRMFNGVQSDDGLLHPHYISTVTMSSTLYHETGRNKWNYQVSISAELHVEDFHRDVSPFIHSYGILQILNVASPGGRCNLFSGIMSPWGIRGGRSRLYRGHQSLEWHQRLCERIRRQRRGREMRLRRKGGAERR